jgi:hypothetical protein
MIADKVFLLTTFEMETGQAGEDVSEMDRGDLQGYIETRQRFSKDNMFWIVYKDNKGNVINTEQYL